MTAVVATIVLWVPVAQGILAFAISCLHIPVFWASVIIRAALVGLPVIGIVSGVKARRVAAVSQRRRGRGRGLASFAVGLSVMLLLLALGTEGLRLYVAVRLRSPRPGQAVLRAGRRPVPFSHHGVKFSLPPHWRVERDAVPPVEMYLEFNDGRDRQLGPDLMIAVDDRRKDPELMTEVLLQSIEEAMSVTRRTPMTAWGRYAGVGWNIEATTMDDVPVIVRVFTHTSASRSFYIEEKRHLSSSDDVVSALHMIESTFEFDRELTDSDAD
jgi:hypothetical protein